MLKASSSSASATSSAERKRKWSRQQLLRNLQIIGTLPSPLPPVLPPSPPASRSSSPVTGSKRKADVANGKEYTKRSRTGSFSLPPQQRQPSQPPAQVPVHVRASVSDAVLPASRSDPCEDGEVREDQANPPPPPSRGAAVAAKSDVTSTVPIRRPKRGKPGIRHFDSLHEIYYANARKLKYSGDARFWSTYPASHKEHRPLPDPPPLNSSYHKYGGLIARLELVDSLVCFAFAMWNRDYVRRHCNRDNWATIEAFLAWCKNKWHNEEGIDDSEKAFLGLIWMIEGFIHARKVAYSTRQYLNPAIDKVFDTARTDIATAITAAEAKMVTDPKTGLLKSQATPPMLPSPASIAPANSANSTPTNRDGSTPSTNGARSVSILSTYTDREPQGPPIPPRLLSPQYTQSGLPIPPHVTTAANSITVPIGPQFIGGLKDLKSSIAISSNAMSNSQQTLTLPIVARLFPTTFARMIHTSLGPLDEHEPDIEDDEGELFWPGQCVNGEGLGWVCLMGRAMIREFGKEYGYKGIDGIVPKPTLEGQAEDGSGAPSQGQTPVPNPNMHGLPPRPGPAPHVTSTQGQLSVNR